MKYYSTQNPEEQVTLQEAVLKGMPKDKGLYMPEKLSEMSQPFIDNISSLSFHEISYEIAIKLIENDVPKNVLREIIEQAINFDAPLVKVSNKINTLELFHGPTLAFKDFGARFMSRLMAYLIRNYSKTLNILVATSGDTGSAVANGFFELPGINVIVLYPSGKVSNIQEKQIATLGKNIIALEVKGTFDDCQRLVKKALIDNDILEQIILSSANSINISRLIPQIFYYFRAFSQLPKNERKKCVISVPSGNFGNLTAGIIAKKMGLPVHQFIASTNINDVVPEYLRTEVFRPRKSVRTISNAMDVGNPSNFFRMLDLYNHSYCEMNKDICGNKYSDIETRKAIGEVYEKYNYTCDPHGAVGYLGLNDFLERHTEVTAGIFFETAHPAKFKDIVEDEINRTVDIPERLAGYLTREKTSMTIENNYTEFKELLLSSSQYK